MAEIIDYFLVFWVALAGVVYVVSNIFQFNNQVKEKGQKRKNSIPGNHRSSYMSSNDDKYNSSSNYNNDRYMGNQYSNYSSNFDQQPQRFHEKSSDHPSVTQTNDRFYNSSLYGSNYQSHQQLQPGDQYSGHQQHYSDYNNDLYGDIARQTLAHASASTQISHNDQQQFDLGLESHGNSSIIPTASGYNSDCVEWVNSILYLFHTRYDKYGPIIAESINRSLNEKVSSITSLSADYNDLIIEFNGINLDSCTRPELTNIRTESESDRSVSVNCKLYNKRLSFNIAIKSMAPITSVSATVPANQQAQYELILENLEGKVKSMAMLNEKLIVIQFFERPDTKILLKRHYDILDPPRSSSPPLIIEDTLVQIILQTLTQVVVDLYFGDDVDFPQFKQQHHQSTYSNYKNKINTIIKGSASEFKRQIKHDFFGALSGSGGEKERKLFIKIVRAKNINYNQNVSCLLELDTPHQQAISSLKQGSNPFWDEHFLFIVNEKSNELLLELWDSINLSALNNDQLQQQASPSNRKSGAPNNTSKWHKDDLVANAKFLGLARCSIDELRLDPVQKLTLALQPIGTPTDLSNAVGGELQIELLFLEHSVGATGASAERNSGSLKKSQSASSLAYQQGDVVSIDRKLTPSGYVITTTTITKQHQQQRGGSLKSKSKQQHLDQHSKSPSPSPHPSMAITDHSMDDLDAASSNHMSTDLNQYHQQQPQDHSSMAPSDLTSGRTSRSRSRSRSILRAIKKRFSFSRTRSRSVGGESSSYHESFRPEVHPDSPSVLNANESNISMGSHSRASSEASISGRAKSVPTSRDLGELPTIVINKSRLSDTASALAFTRPKSQLVIEVMEPILRNDGTENKHKGRPRYYAVPDDAPSKRKWLKRGLKLHLFNEHQFVACHLPGSRTCHLCGRVFSRRPGKQGYKCRNCHLLSHKQCHVKVDHNCPYASRDGLKLEFIDSDPPSNLINDLNQAYADQENQNITSSGSKDARTNQRHKQTSSVSLPSRGKQNRMTAKSISMEVDDR